jgi:hypothetical protein
MQAAAHTPGGFGGVPQSVGKEFTDSANSDLDELEIACAIAAGELSSPQRVVNMSLFAIRITGTGTAYRSKDDQFTYRPPELYLTDDFLARCNGLQVIYEHPEKATLDSEEFADRTIGSIFLPYIQGDEVWGIAKIYDDAAIAELSDPDKKMSTSPTVVFRTLTENAIIELDNGKAMLIEGKPSLLDHVAICPYGVWDKGGEPAGVLNNSTGAIDMPLTAEEFQKKADEYEARAKADAEEKDALKQKIADMEAGAKPAPAMTAADKAKADAEEEEAKKKADAEAEEEKKKADAEAEEKAERVKADAALRTEVQALRAGLTLSDEDRNKIATAQMRAETVFRAFGDSTPAPMLGETVTAYRKRLVGKMKDHSPAWKPVDMSVIADSMIDLVEQQVYADASVAARNPVSVAGGGLREIKRTSPGGHQISEFVGDVSAFTSAFKPPVRRFVTQMNKGDIRH